MSNKFTEWTDKCWFPEWMNRIGKEGETAAGPAVMVLQFILLGMGLYHEPITSRYDYNTAEAVELLQKKLGFTGDDVDGNFGQGMREALAEQLGIDINGILRPLLVSSMPTNSIDPDGKWFPWK